MLALTLVAAAPAPDGKSSGPKHLSAKALAAELSDDDGASQGKPASTKASSTKPKATKASDRATTAEEKPSRPKVTAAKPTAAPVPDSKAATISDTKAAGGQKPVWEVATVPPDAVEVAKSTYIVQPGDTLSAVVRKTGEGADVIAHDNDLAAPFKLRPGQKLKIAGGRYHTVKKGQSGIAIARAYQVEWSKIIELNHLQDPFTLREGQRLLLPPAKDVAKMSLEQRAAAFQIDLTDLATGSEPALAPTAKAAAPSLSPTRQLAPTTPVAEPEVAFVGRFDWPVQGKIIRPYGPMDNGGRNDGIAIAAPRGTVIAAAADGVVMWVGEHPAFGNVVLIKHGSGWITIYGNADKLVVKRGQAVKIGQTIARVGTSGTSADLPQTFFEVLQGRKPVNPMGLLPKRARQPDGNDSDADPDQNSD
ncbi:MAG TPA: peptidoglycan DD-metalloendopeptidase family protein [Sphingomonas sp.]|uniref:peptidoglycan DD-metalloendopeptidase family protein n=1 Tax=Sphingomonas sp. TaxID=28214 RepID=UPI002BB937CB|nr:peptidoglycan DD-metalloendopeptidase family protein [Sphingomonas sp.]HMI19360.1 peptidoglycan DD-metalloendopeptidase family protein [Sphingomonas sp.]